MTRPTATATLALCAGPLAALLAPTLHVPAAAQPLTQGGWVCDAYDQSFDDTINAGACAFMGD